MSHSLPAAGAQRESGAMRLRFTWRRQFTKWYNMQYMLTLARHVDDLPYAVTFDEHEGVKPAGEDAYQMKPTGRNAVAVRGEQMVMTLLVRMLHEKRALGAAAEFNFECSLMQGEAVFMDELCYPEIVMENFDKLDKDDRAAYLECTRRMIAEPDISDALLFLCTNSAM